MEYLPESLLIEIFALCETSNFKSISLCCKRWFKIIGESQILWKKLCLTHWRILGENYLRQCNSTLLIGYIPFRELYQQRSFAEHRWNRCADVSATFDVRKIHNGPIECVKIAEQSQFYTNEFLLLSCSSDGQLKGWRNGNFDDPEFVLHAKSTGTLENNNRLLCLDHRDKLVAASTSNKSVPGSPSIFLWNYSTQQLVSHFDLKTLINIESSKRTLGECYSLNFVPFESNQIAFSVGESLYCLDIERSVICQKIGSHQSVIWSSCWLQQDGNSSLLLSSSFDKKVRVWDLRSPDCCSVLTGHNSSVNIVKANCYNSNQYRMTESEQYIVMTGSLDSEVKKWDLRTNSTMATLCGNRDAVCSLSFDSRKVFGGYFDGAVLHWDFQTGELLNVFEASNGKVKSNEGNKFQANPIFYSPQCSSNLNNLLHMSTASITAMVTTPNQLITGATDQRLRTWSI